MRFRQDAIFDSIYLNKSGEKDISKDMKKQAFLDKRSVETLFIPSNFLINFLEQTRPQEGMDPAMDPEKLISQCNYELKHDNPSRALDIVNHALKAIIDLDPLLFWTPSGMKERIFKELRKLQG